MCGKMADMKEHYGNSLKNIKYPVIEDCAQAIGSKFDKKKSGSVMEVSGLLFHTSI